MRSSQALNNSGQQMAVNGGAQHKESSSGFTSEPGLIGNCQLAVEIEAGLERLGGYYNELEEQLHKVECVARSQQESFKALEERLQVLEAWRKTVQDANEKSTKTTTSSHALETDAVGSTPREQLDKHESTLFGIIQRLQQLEEKEPAATSTALQSTHDLAQSLIQRLKDGDVLVSSDVSQLKVALHQPGNATSTGSKKQLSTLAITESTETEGKPLKRKRGRPRLSSLERNSDEEPLAKRARGRPSLRASEGTAIQQPTGKKPQGRPRKNAPSPKKAKSESDQNALDMSKMSTTTSVDQEATELADTSLPVQQVLPSTEAVPILKSAQKETGESIPETAVSTISEITNETEDSSLIPPERRSGREHKPTKPFGDVMSWKEANLHMQHLKPHAALKSNS